MRLILIPLLLTVCACPVASTNQGQSVLAYSGNLSVTLSDVSTDANSGANDFAFAIPGAANNSFFCSAVVGVSAGMRVSTDKDASVISFTLPGAFSTTATYAVAGGIENTFAAGVGKAGVSFNGETGLSGVTKVWQATEGSIDVEPDADNPGSATILFNNVKLVPGVYSINEAKGTFTLHAVINITNYRNELPACSLGLAKAR